MKFNLLHKLENIKKNPGRIKNIENPTEKQQMDAIKANPALIKDIKHPTQKVQEEIAKMNPELVKDIQNPSEAVLLEVIKQQPFKVLELENPSVKVQQCALEHTSELYSYLKEFSYEIQLKSVAEKPENIMNLEKPSDEIQNIAIKIKPELIAFIQDPCQAAQKIALEADPKLFALIQNPSVLTQLEAINKDIRNYLYIKNPTQQVQMAVINQSPEYIAYISDPSEELQMIAVSANVQNVMKINKPTEKVMMYVVQKDYNLIEACVLYPQIIELSKKLRMEAEEKEKKETKAIFEVSDEKSEIENMLEQEIAKKEKDEKDVKHLQALKKILADHEEVSATKAELSKELNIEGERDIQQKDNRSETETAKIPDKTIFWTEEVPLSSSLKEITIKYFQYHGISVSDTENEVAMCLIDEAEELFAKKKSKTQIAPDSSYTLNFGDQILNYFIKFIRANNIQVTESDKDRMPNILQEVGNIYKALLSNCGNSKELESEGNASTISEESEQKTTNCVETAFDAKTQVISDSANGETQPEKNGSQPQTLQDTQQKEDTPSDTDDFKDRSDVQNNRISKSTTAINESKGNTTTISEESEQKDASLELNNNSNKENMQTVVNNTDINQQLQQAIEEKKIREQNIAKLEQLKKLHIELKNLQRKEFQLANEVKTLESNNKVSIVPNNISDSTSSFSTKVESKVQEQGHKELNYKPYNENPDNKNSNIEHMQQSKDNTVISTVEMASNSSITEIIMNYLNYNGIQNVESMQWTINNIEKEYNCKLKKYGVIVDETPYTLNYNDSLKDYLAKFIEHNSIQVCADDNDLMSITIEQLNDLFKNLKINQL